MITDNQVRKLMKYLQEKRSLGLAALKSGMSEKPARKHRDLEKLPSELKAEQYAHGEREKINSKESGEGSNRFWEPTRVSKPRPYLSTFSERNLAVFQMVRFGAPNER